MPAAPPVSLDYVILRFRALGRCACFSKMEKSLWLSKGIKWNFYNMMSFIVRLYDVNIKKNALYFCVFYKLIHRNFVLQFVISWRAPVTHVLHT